MDTHWEASPGNDVGKTEKFGMVGGLGAGLAGAAPFIWPKSAAATTVGTFSLEVSQWVSFFHVLQSLWTEGWASNCACNLGS